MIPMCRILGYLGLPIPLSSILEKPEHSLIVQSYSPQEMTSGVVNADGFGMGWYDKKRDMNPFIYKNTLPIWGDINLPHLSRYIESNCILANVRSATPGQATDLSNCQPFSYKNLLFIHNGFIQNFRQRLYRPICDRISDIAYQSIFGSTDSEHIFALLLHTWQASPDLSLEQALKQTLITLIELTNQYQVNASANIILTDGHRLIASRFSTQSPAPSLYWITNDSAFPTSVIIASEPLFQANWNSCPENSIVSLGTDLQIQTHKI